jgi:hypothetical protein
MQALIYHRFEQFHGFLVGLNRGRLSLVGMEWEVALKLLV